MAADALAESSDVYGSDNDPELVEAAIPFGLKTMESVLDKKPEHRGLLTSLTSGFTSYSYGFVQQQAFMLQDEDPQRAEELMGRSRKLYLRARGYGFRALNLTVENFEGRLRASDQTVLEDLEPEHVPLLYWTAAAWALAVAAGELDPEEIADFPLVDIMVQRAVTLDADWNRGALYDFLIQLEGARPGADLDRADEYFARAVELSDGRRAGTFVGYAEVVCVQRQDGVSFVSNLRRALAVDVDALPEERLNNILMKARARVLLERSADLFLEDPLADDEEALGTNEFPSLLGQGS